MGAGSPIAGVEPRSTTLKGKSAAPIGPVAFWSAIVPVQAPGTGNETSTTKAPLLPTETQMKYPSTAIGGTAGSASRNVKWAVTSGKASSRLFGSDTVITSRFAPTRMTVVVSVGSTVVDPAAGEPLGGAGAAGVAAGVALAGGLATGPELAVSPGSGRATSDAIRSTKTSGPAPNQIRSRSRPAASTRNASAVCAIAYPLAEPLSIRAYWTPHASAARRISAAVPVSPVNPAS